MQIQWAILLIVLGFSLSCSGQHIPHTFIEDETGPAREFKGNPALSFEGVTSAVLEAKCLDCHGRQISAGGQITKKIKGDVDFTDYESLVTGLDAVIIPGDPENSWIIKVIKDGSMPDDKRPRVTPEELAILVDWILMGAPKFEEELSEEVSPPEDPVLPPTEEVTPPPPALPPPVIVETELVSFDRVFREILEPKCSRCHSGPLAEGFVDVTDLDALKNNFMFTDLLVKGSPMQSRLYRVVDSGKMPRRGDRLSASELELMRLWIYEGEDL